MNRKPAISNEVAIGRWMNGVEMPMCPPSAAARSVGGRDVRLHAAAGLEPILAGHNNAGTDVETALDHRTAFSHLANGDRLHGDSRIRLDDIDVHAVRPALDG